MALRAVQNPLLRRVQNPAPPLPEDPELRAERVRHALRVLREAPNLSPEARRRGTRALEAACARLSRPRPG